MSLARLKLCVCMFESDPSSYVRLLRLALDAATATMGMSILVVVLVVCSATATTTGACLVLFRIEVHEHCFFHVVH